MLLLCSKGTAARAAVQTFRLQCTLPSIADLREAKALLHDSGGREDHIIAFNGSCDSTCFAMVIYILREMILGV